MKTLKATMEDAYEKAREHLKATSVRSEELYNKRVHGREFQVGELVWLNNPVVPRGGDQESCTVHGLGPSRLFKKYHPLCTGSRVNALAHEKEL